MGSGALSPDGVTRRGLLEAARLYLVVTEALCRLPRDRVLAEAVEGGVDIIQVREKSLSDDGFRRIVRATVAFCRSRGVLCIVNDRPDVARDEGADGVHVGAGDPAPEAARAAVGPEAIVGFSVHSAGEARRALEGGADYVGVGTVCPTATRPLAGAPIGEGGARRLADLVRPIVAFPIGGIDRAVAARIRAAGLQRAAVASAILGSPDPRAEAQAIRAALTGPLPR